MFLLIQLSFQRPTEHPPLLASHWSKLHSTKQPQQNNLDWQSLMPLECSGLLLRLSAPKQCTTFLLVGEFARRKWNHPTSHSSPALLDSFIALYTPKNRAIPTETNQPSLANVRQVVARSVEWKHRREQTTNLTVTVYSTASRWSCKSIGWAVCRVARLSRVPEVCPWNKQTHVQTVLKFEKRDLRKSKEKANTLMLTPVPVAVTTCRRLSRRAEKYQTVRLLLSACSVPAATNGKCKRNGT